MTLPRKDLKTRPYSMDKKDLKKLTKGQLIKLLMNNGPKPMSQIRALIPVPKPRTDKPMPQIRASIPVPKPRTPQIIVPYQNQGPINLYPKLGQIDLYQNLGLR